MRKLLWLNEKNQRLTFEFPILEANDARKTRV
jgi:hypothetical protein